VPASVGHRVVMTSRTDTGRKSRADHLTTCGSGWRRRRLRDIRTASSVVAF